jgi:hypothetical protein
MAPQIMPTLHNGHVEVAVLQHRDPQAFFARSYLLELSLLQPCPISRTTYTPTPFST